MDQWSGVQRVSAPELDHAPERPAHNVAIAVSERQTSTSTTPFSSAPATPQVIKQDTQRSSYAAASPLNSPSSQSSSAPRRPSSATPLGDRPTSSPGLMRKLSRSSLGGQSEELVKAPTPKRSISNLITGLREAHSSMEIIEEPVPPTAPQIAADHFTRELLAHARPETSSETVVILHDHCYGHRYSRLKTTKTTLSMIVERPERLHASVLGASAAYVRLGEHHAGARFAPHPGRSEAAPPPFKIRRTTRSLAITSPFVTTVHGTEWMSELEGLCKSAGENIASGAKELERHSTAAEPEKRKLHEGDLYLCSESLNAFQGALGGVADAVDTVFGPTSQTKRAFVAIRPPGHHCSTDYPSGFCWLNNVHVGIEYATQIHGLTHAAIFDFDLHHGDGSQAIAWERNSKNNQKRLNAKLNSKVKLGADIGYYSLHDINSYPCEMGDDEKVQAASLCIENAHGQSIWNVHLQAWKDEDEFWTLYETQYSILLEKAKGFLRHHTTRLRNEGKVTPKAAIFISAGFDASEWESAGMQRHKVNVPTEFYARFTQDIVQLAQDDTSGCDGRVISVLEGGYSDRALCSGVLSHLSGLCAKSAEASRKDTPSTVGLERMMRGLGINGEVGARLLQYDKSWWSAANLTALEMKVNPPPPPPPGKKVRTGAQPTYATPTESFAYKVRDTDKFARTISGTLREVPKPARPPTPPPPEVDWVVATQELSKLLIPGDRQTKSCTPEELAPVRTKKERQSIAPIISTEDSSKPRQLRDRRGKGAAYPESAYSDEPESVRSVSRSDRRQTIADLPLASDPTDLVSQRRPSRRLSAGSTLSSVTADLDPFPPPVPALPKSQHVYDAPVKQPPRSDAGVVVKRTRAPAKPKKPVVTASAPVSPVIANKSSNDLPSQSELTNTATAACDVDSLTSGLKKITLKIGSREEHERKQKEKLDADRRARALKAAETRKANAAAKKAALKDSPRAQTVGAQMPMPTTNVKKAATTMQPLPTSIIPGTTPSIQSNTRVDTQSEAVVKTELDVPDFAETAYKSEQSKMMANVGPDVMMVDTTALGTQRDAMRPAPVPSLGDQTFQHEQPHTLPAAPTAKIEFDAQTNSAYKPTPKSLKVNESGSPAPVLSSSSPIRPASRDQLPIWSSSGVIPFASMSGRATPTTFSGGQGSPYDGSSIENPAVQHVDVPTAAAANVKQEDIWDVPVTPQS